jgi:hypothetical protein
MELYVYDDHEDPPEKVYATWFEEKHLGNDHVGHQQQSRLGLIESASRLFGVP